MAAAGRGAAGQLQRQRRAATGVPDFPAAHGSRAQFGGFVVGAQFGYPHLVLPPRLAGAQGTASPSPWPAAPEGVADDRPGLRPGTASAEAPAAGRRPPGDVAMGSPPDPCVG